MTDRTHLPHVLYRMFDRDGNLLYVGITNNPKNRFREHSKAKPWWSEVSNIGVETFQSRKELAWAEYRAIRDEGPRYNVACNPVPSVDPPQCRTCGSPAPNMMPDDYELLTDDGKHIPFCTDPFHFPGDAGAEMVHANRDLLRQSGLLRLSAVAQTRLDVMRAAMAPLSVLYPDTSEAPSDESGQRSA